MLHRCLSFYSGIFRSTFIFAAFFCVFINFKFAVAQTPAQNQTAQGFFNSGVAALQKNDFKSARENFQSSLKLDPQQAQSYYNWGWVEFKDQHLGLAIGLWRKALDIDPQSAVAQSALSFALKKIEHTQIAHEAQISESFRDTILTGVPLLNFLLLTNLFLLLSGWLWFRQWGRHKRALDEETPLPSLPVTAVVLSIGFVLCLGLSSAKVLDLQTSRGTITAKQVSARTTPDANGTVLFDLYEGLEVIVQQSSGDWFQVTYPGGMTGWVPKSQIFVSAGRAP